MSEVFEKISKEKPLKDHYIDDDQLGHEFCQRVGCNACFGNDENGEPNGYGCNYQESYVDDNNDLILNFDDAYFLQTIKLEQLEKENKILRECVEFYADPEVYIETHNDCYFKIEPKNDNEIIRHYEHKQKIGWIGTVKVGGKKAREALKQLKESK